MKLRCALMRHGQAASFHAQGDSERPLTPRGEEQAAATARQLHALGWSIPLIYHSAATRTTRTAELVESTWLGLGVQASLTSHPSLYLGDMRHITGVLAGLSTDDVTEVVLIGHNPGWSRVASAWTGIQVGLDVANAALMSVEAESWLEACALEGEWELEHFVHSP